VLRLVGENPGITVREVGERLGVDATGLYRVVKRLSDEGRVRKDGRRLQPVDSQTRSERKQAATGDSAKPAPAAAGTETPEATPSSESEPSPTVGAGAPSDDR
jgi:Winged helix-turn-helix DNA-binding